MFSRGPMVARAAESWDTPARLAKKGGFACGARVFHEKFGYGIVTSVQDDRLDVVFETSGQKRILDRFVKAA